MSNSNANPLQGLTTLLQLQKRAREAENQLALGFVMVNETRRLFDYRQAALWRPEQGVCAVSGIPQVDNNAPYTLWLKRLFQSQMELESPHTLTANEVPAELADEWAQWLPSHLILMPLFDAQQKLLGILMLARDSAWQGHEQALLTELNAAYAHALSAQIGQRGRQFNWHAVAQRKVAIIATLGLILLLMLPVRLSVLASAEVVASDPILVRAPLEGVVDQFHVQPNQPVKAGQLLFELDDTTLRNKLSVALKTLQVAKAEYLQSAQQAVFNEESKVQLAILKGRWDAKSAEASYLQELLERIKIRAPQAGLAVFSDTNDWLGRPVDVGERVLAIADPTQVELQIQLPVADSIRLGKEAEVKLFLKVSPDQPVPAALYYSAYRAEVGPDGVLAYRLKARFNDTMPRLGLTGTAKLYGEEVSLFYYLMRRPLAAARQWLGL